MKKAFTLAEILVTLTIIGIVAALIVPAISNLRPDKNKTAYLQVYDTISQTVKSLAANSRLYPVCKDPNEADSVNCTEYPLFNTNRPLDDRYNDAIYQGDRKLCSLMALSLGVAEDDINCSNTAYAFNAADYTDGFANESFVTKNGMRWRIVPAVASTADGTLAQYQADIYVDVNPENNNINDEDESCIYSSDSCEEPDIFKFMVSANGDVTPADPMGREYINTRKSLVRKKYELDSDVIAEMSPERSFSYIPCRALTEEEQCTADGGFWYDEACNACPVGQNLIDGVCQTPGGGGGGTPSGGKQKIDNYILVAGTTGEYITVRAMYPPASDLWINVPSYKRHGTYSHSCNLRDGLYQKITAGSYYGAYLSPSGIPGTSGNPARFKVDGKAVYFAGIHCGYWSDYSPNGITVSPASDDKYNYIICTETSGCPAGFKFDSPLATPPQ